MLRETNVQTYIEHGGRARPAVNVKVRNFGPSVLEVEDRFGCTTGRAQEALEIAWQSAQELFWHSVAPRIARESFIYDVEVHTEGRSGGWLVVHGLPTPVEDWDDTLVRQWHKFALRIHDAVDSFTDDDEVMGFIDDNGLWLERHNVTIVVEECGCCSQWHPSDYHGQSADCRNDTYRFPTPEHAERIYGAAPTTFSRLKAMLDIFDPADKAQEIIYSEAKRVVEAVDSA